MEKEKEIEKIKYMRRSQLVMDLICPSDDCDKPESCTICKAERLDDLGYRKIPDGAVVLTREELAEKYVMREMYDLANACHDEKCAEFNLLSYQYHKLEKRLEQARKETAREYHDKIAKVIHERDYVEGYAEIGMNEENDEILKEYGVGVEE